MHVFIIFNSFHLKILLILPKKLVWNSRLRISDIKVRQLQVVFYILRGKYRGFAPVSVFLVLKFGDTHGLTSVYSPVVPVPLVLVFRNLRDLLFNLIQVVEIYRLVLLLATHHQQIVLGFLHTFQVHGLVHVRPLVPARVLEDRRLVVERVLKQGGTVVLGDFRSGQNSLLIQVAPDEFVLR